MKPQHKIYSLYRLMMLELNLPTIDHRLNEVPQVTSNDETLEQVVNMVKVPLVLEKFMLFGLMVCLNSFLSIFTLVALKICIVLWSAVDRLILRCQKLDVALELRKTCTPHVSLELLSSSFHCHTLIFPDYITMFGARPI